MRSGRFRTPTLKDLHTIEMTHQEMRTVIFENIISFAQLGLRGPCQASVIIIVMRSDRVSPGCDLPTAFRLPEQGYRRSCMKYLAAAHLHHHVTGPLHLPSTNLEFLVSAAATG